MVHCRCGQVLIGFYAQQSATTTGASAAPFYVEVYLETWAARGRGILAGDAGLVEGFQRVSAQIFASTMNAL
jgi:hypothetical protein